MVRNRPTSKSRSDSSSWIVAMNAGALECDTGFCTLDVMRGPLAPVGVISSLAAFAIFATGSKNFDELVARDDFQVTGEAGLLRALVERLDVFEFGFEIVLP